MEARSYPHCCKFCYTWGSLLSSKMSQMIDTCRPHFVALWVSPTSHAALVCAPSSDVSVYGLCVASVAILMNYLRPSFSVSHSCWPSTPWATCQTDDWAVSHSPSVGLSLTQSSSSNLFTSSFNPVPSLLPPSQAACSSQSPEYWDLVGPGSPYLPRVRRRD